MDSIMSAGYSGKVAQFKPAAGGRAPSTIYVFDKDSKTVFTLSQNFNFSKYKINYVPSDGYPAQANSRNAQNNFPHNFQLVQIGSQA